MSSAVRCDDCQNVGLAAAFAPGRPLAGVMSHDTASGMPMSRKTSACAPHRAWSRSSSAPRTTAGERAAPDRHHPDLKRGPMPSVRMILSHGLEAHSAQSAIDWYVTLPGREAGSCFENTSLGELRVLMLSHDEMAGVGPWWRSPRARYELSILAGCVSPRTSRSGFVREPFLLPLAVRPLRPRSHIPGIVGSDEVRRLTTIPYVAGGGRPASNSAASRTSVDTRRGGPGRRRLLARNRPYL